MARTSVNRSARSGRFVKQSQVKKSPGTTTTERVGTGTSNKRPVVRSATSGRFVRTEQARKNPGGTITQRV